MKPIKTKLKMWRDMTKEERQEEQWKRDGRPRLIWNSRKQGTLKGRI